MAKKAGISSIKYDVHPVVPYAAAIIANLAKTTGRSLDDWIALLDKSGLSEEKARRDWLKSEHGVGGTTANLIATRSVGEGLSESDEAAYLAEAPRMVDALYSGKKAALRPIHDALIALARRQHPDVKISPCKTMVPLYRNHVVANIKPTTNTRVDLGLAVGAAKVKLPARLIDTGGAAKKDRITHRIGIERLEDIDDFVAKWLSTAYDLDA